MGEAIGTFEQIISLEPQHETLLRALRALAFELHPDLVEVARPGDRAVRELLVAACAERREALRRPV